MAHDEPPLGVEFFQDPMPESPSHADIIRVVRKIEHAQGLRVMADQRRDTALSDMKKMLEEIKASIGTEGKDEYGKPIGTGLTGRMMRAELRWLWFDAYANRAAAMLGTVVVLGAVIWWLVRPALENLFHPGATQ